MKWERELGKSKTIEKKKKEMRFTGKSKSGGNMKNKKRRISEKIGAGRTKERGTNTKIGGEKEGHRGL